MIERAAFGRTGHDSSRVIFGSAAVARLDQETADRLLPLLLEYGVNHIDTAADYGDAELRLAPWLAQHPAEFFLATKTHARDGDGARASLERSLTRLGVDHVDDAPRAEVRQRHARCGGERGLEVERRRQQAAGFGEKREARARVTHRHALLGREQDLECRRARVGRLER